MIKMFVYLSSLDRLIDSVKKSRGGRNRVVMGKSEMEDHEPKSTHRAGGRERDASKCILGEGCREYSLHQPTSLSYKSARYCQDNGENHVLALHSLGINAPNPRN